MIGIKTKSRVALRAMTVTKFKAVIANQTTVYLMVSWFKVFGAAIP